MGVPGREVSFTDGGWEVRQIDARANARGNFILRHRRFVQDAMEELAKDPRRYLPRGLVHGNNASRMQAFFTFLFRRENLNFRLNHQPIAGRAVQLDFSEQGDTSIGQQAFCVAFAMKPPRLEYGARPVMKRNLE